MEENTDASRPLKRRKIRLACQECRDKKTRCDGARPICNACIRKRVGPEQCIYLDDTPDVDSQYVKSLEERIRELERARDKDSDGGPERLHSWGRGQEQERERLLRMENQDIPSHPGLSLHDSHVAAFHLMDLQTQASQLTNKIDIRAPTQNQREQPIARYSSPLGLSEAQGHGVDSSPLGHSQNIIHATLQTQPPPRSHSDHNGQTEHCSGIAGECQPRISGDAMGASEATPTESGRAIFLGPSSAAAFMREVQESSGRARGRAFGDDSVSSITSRPSHPRRKRSRDELSTLLDGLTLPPRKIADGHLQNYWQRAHPLYPIIHKPTFMSRYDRIWSQASNDNESSLFDDNVHIVRAFYATLNITFAIGCVSSHVVVEAPFKKSAENYFERSQELLKEAEVDNGSIQLVQALILTANYLQSTDMVNKCWVTVGTAIRVAQGIGIHLESASESQAEREERKRTWWCCLLMDRVLSMTLGRPAMATWPTTVPIPEPIDDELLSQAPGSSSQPLQKQEVSRSALFTHTLKLTEILMSVLRNLYPPPNQTPKNTVGNDYVADLTSVVQIDADLARWRQQLPDYLIHWSLEASSDADLVYTRQAASLHCRYLHLRILLFRPITMALSNGSFLQIEASGRSTDFHYTIFTGCIRSCIRAAQGLVQLIHSPSHARLLPPWWYAIFYLYTSGTVLLSVLLSPNLQRAYGENLDGLVSTWSHCIETLSRYEKQGSTFARQSLRILQAVGGEKSRLQQPHLRDDNVVNERQEIQATSGIGHTQTVPGFEHNNILLGEGDFSDVWWPPPAANHDWLNNIPDESEIRIGNFGYQTLS